MLIARSPRDPYRRLRVLAVAGFIRVAMCFARAATVGDSRNPQFKSSAKSLFNACCRLRGQQRMATETEEIVVYANLLYSKDLRENFA